MAISRTAQHVALVRALETTESARSPLFQDRFAACLLPRSLRFVVQLARAQWLRQWLFRYADARAPGVRSWDVLQFVGGTAERSRFVFTYGPRSVIADNSAGSATDKVFSEVRRLGEPWTFGIEPSELPEFVARFHLTLERNVRHDTCRRMYLSSAMADPTGLEFSHLAVARVELPIAGSIEQARVTVPS